METSRTKIRFWNGLRTIGGTIVSAEYEKSRVIFDFGLNHNPAENFSELVKTRCHALVEDYINLNKIPAMDGMYSRNDLRNLVNITSAEEDERNSAVIISHLHIDHIGAMGLVSPKIPIFLSEDSLKLYEALEEIGEGVYGERSYNSCRYDEVLKIGDIKVTPVQLDHDIIGACGFFIETPDVKIVYSGDLRLHGKHPELTRDFISKAYNFRPNLLILEGTMINREKNSKEIKPSSELKGINTEEQVKEIIIERLKSTSGLVIINISNTNLERIIDIIEASEELDRKIILEPETAYLITKLTNNKNFMIYVSEGLKIELERNTAPIWIRELIKSYKAVSYYEINLSHGKYLLQNSFKNIMELLDLNVERSVYIHSNAAPLGAYDPDFEKLQNFLKKLKVKYENIGTSGHAAHSHLKYIIDEIQPEILIPLHSFFPEKLYPKSKIQFMPEYGVEYKIEDGKIIKL